MLVLIEWVSSGACVQLTLYLSKNGASFVWWNANFENFEISTIYTAKLIFKFTSEKILLHFVVLEILAWICSDKGGYFSR